MTQSEQELERDLISSLTGLGYDRVRIRDSQELKANLKTQLEKHNKTQFSDREFNRILNHLDKGNVFDRADLDYQTSKEFNYFSPNCVDSTDNTRQLVEQMTGENSLIVTTIQKLNNGSVNPAMKPKWVI